MRFDDAAARLTALGARAGERTVRPDDGGPPDPAPGLPHGPRDLDVTFTDSRLRPRRRRTSSARAAAVLALVHPDADGRARIVLTERLTYDGHHSGEISLPGGKAEPADADAAATALREAAEEVGLDVDAARVRVVGRLDDVFVAASDFLVTPVVAVAERPPVLVASDDEVARILTPPLAAFLPDAPLEMVERTVGGWAIRYGGYRIDGVHVWGATGRILGQLGAVLAEAERSV